MVGGQTSQGVIHISSNTPDTQIQQVGASKYRELRAAGKTPFPPAPRLDQLAKDFAIQSPTTKAIISCRGFFGDGAPPVGIYYHIHGGGYVLGSASGLVLFDSYSGLISKTDMNAAIQSRFDASPNPEEY
jgi:acetyl esterase/lipase